MYSPERLEEYTCLHSKYVDMDCMCRRFWKICIYYLRSRFATQVKRYFPTFVTLRITDWFSFATKAVWRTQATTAKDSIGTYQVSAARSKKRRYQDVCSSCFIWWINATYCVFYAWPYSFYLFSTVSCTRKTRNRRTCRATIRAIRTTL